MIIIFIIRLSIIIARIIYNNQFNKTLNNSSDLIIRNSSNSAGCANNVNNVDRVNNVIINQTGIKNESNFRIPTFNTQQNNDNSIIDINKNYNDNNDKK